MVTGRPARRRERAATLERSGTMKRILMMAVLGVSAAGCSELTGALPGIRRSELPGEPVTLSRVQGVPRHYSGMEERARLVVESADAWQAAWSRMHQGTAPSPAAPEIDFAREVVVVAAMGGRPTGGYSIEVSAAARQGGETTVRVVETSPARSCVVTQAITTPVDAVRLPRTALPVVFSEVQAVHRC
jgi:hypothetical protein